MITANKQQVIELAKDLYMKDQAKNGLEGLEDSQPELCELLEEGWIDKAQESLQKMKQTEYALKQYEQYVESFDSKQLSTITLKNESNNISSMSIPFDITEAKDTGFFACGTTQSGKSTLAKHLVKKIVDDGYSVYVIDVSKVWSNDTPIHNTVIIHSTDNLIDIPTNTSTVLDISELEYTQQFNYVSSFCKGIYDWHKSKGFKKAPFEFVVFEESHVYFPNGCFRSPRKYSSCINLVTIGANFNLRFGAITQFPAALDKALVKVTQQRYFGWTTEYNDRNYVRSFLGKEWIDPKQPDSVYNLQKGQFLYQLRNKIEKIQSSAYTDTPQQSSYSLNGQTIQLEYNLIPTDMYMTNRSSV